MFPSLLPSPWFGGTLKLVVVVVVQSRPTLCNCMHGLQRSRLSCPSSPGVCSNSCPLSQWCHSTILSSVTPFSSCLQSFSASGSFPMSQLFTSGDQSNGASASATVLSVNIQGWFPLGLTGLIFLLSRGLSRVFSSTTVRNHQFFGAQPAVKQTWVWSLGWEDPPEEGMATCFSILAWRIPTDRGASWATVHGVSKSQTRRSN